MKPPLAEGKLPTDVLARLLRHTSRSPLLTVGAAPGEDAAVAPGAPTIVITADPITFTDERLGAYVVAVNANDIVAMGERPVYLTTTILLAPGATEETLERIFSDIADACGKAGILWVGGHTEVTPSFPAPWCAARRWGSFPGTAPDGRGETGRLPVHDEVGGAGGDDHHRAAEARRVPRGAG